MTGHGVGMIEVYLCTRRGVLHKGVLDAGRRMTLEADNLDQSQIAWVMRVDEAAEMPYKRKCRRCFPVIDAEAEGA